MYGSGLVTSSFCTILKRTPTFPLSNPIHTHTPIERHTHTDKCRQPSPHYIPAEAILIHIVCSVRPHFSFPPRIEADTHMADEQSGETAGSTHMYVKFLTNWPTAFLCVCVSFWEHDDSVHIRLALGYLSITDNLIIQGSKECLRNPFKIQGVPGHRSPVIHKWTYSRNTSTQICSSDISSDHFAKKKKNSTKTINLMWPLSLSWF